VFIAYKSDHQGGGTVKTARRKREAKKDKTRERKSSASVESHGRETVICQKPTSGPRQLTGGKKFDFWGVATTEGGRGVFSSLTRQKRILGKKAQ